MQCLLLLLLLLLLSSSSSSAGVNTISSRFTALTLTHNRMLQYKTGLPLMFKTFGAHFQFLWCVLHAKPISAVYYITLTVAGVVQHKRFL
jgi:hypothetical protein